MSALPKWTGGQKWQRLPPRRQSNPKLFMQRMWQAIQRTDRNSDVKTKNTRKYRVLCAENEDRGDGNQSKWESARKIAHQHHEMGGKTGEPVTVMESRCASRRRCNHRRRWNLYSHRREPSHPENQKGGQWYLSNVTVAIGLRQRQEAKPLNYLRK